MHELDRNAERELELPELVLVAAHVTVQSRGDALRRIQCAEGFKVRNVALDSNITQQGGLLEHKNNKIETKRSGISATISRCCRSCRLPEAAP